MGKNKKVFIDRNKAITFHLVHRSQHDPLVTDETAPQRVLVEASARQQLSGTECKLDSDQRYEEQKKYGIHFDDDYNYLQHLKRPEQETAWEYVENPNQARKRLDDGLLTMAPKLNLPSSVFATEFEEDEGMLNKAALHPGPRPDWDPDVVAALDDDFNYDSAGNQLEDDFVLKAMGEESEYESNNDDEIASDDLNESSNNDDDEINSELMDRLAPLMREGRFAEEETKSRFTEYSMSSSVIRRNQQLMLLDDRFEKFYASYDDPELGDLALEDIEGALHQKHPFVIGCYKEFKKSKKLEPYNKEWDCERLQLYRDITTANDDPTEELVEYEVKGDTDKWDCESILSTYSNNYNHPQLIKEPKKKKQSQANIIEIDAKTGLPVNVLRGDNSQLITVKALAKLSEHDPDDATKGPKSLCAKSVQSTLSVLSIRPKDETPEEKHERKRLLKEYRNERRIERKGNAEAFKQEKKRQTFVKINQRTNQQGNKIL